MTRRDGTAVDELGELVLVEDAVETASGRRSCH